MKKLCETAKEQEDKVVEDDDSLVESGIWKQNPVKIKPPSFNNKITIWSNYSKWFDANKLFNTVPVALR